MKYYFIKIALHGISPMVWRRLRIAGNVSLATLHECIQIVNSWKNFYLHKFHIYGKDYGINYEGGLYYRDDVYNTFLDEFHFDVGEKFTYEYNFFKHIIHDIRIENIEESLPLDPIVCLSGSGMPDVKKQDIIRVKYKLLELIATKRGKLKAKDILRFQKETNRIKFNKYQINIALASLK